MVLSKKVSGFTLLEILIALVIFLLGSLSIWSLFAVAIDTYNESVDSQVAAFIAESIVAELENVDVVKDKPLPIISERESLHFPDYKYEVSFVEAKYDAVFVTIKISYIRRGQKRVLDFHTVLNKTLAN